MKNLTLVTVFGLSFALGARAHAGYRFDLDQTKTLCLSIAHPNSIEALRGVTEEAVASLKATCDEHPRMRGATSQLKAIEIQEIGTCDFGFRYEYHVTASCYLP